MGMSDLIDTIRREVEASGKSRYRISAESGINKAALSRLMSGERGLSVESVEKLADALGLEIIIRRKRRGTKKGG